MKNRIYKYFFNEFLGFFCISLFAFSLIVWTVQSVNFLDLVIDDGHAFTTYFLYSFLTISKIVTKLIPFCFLIAVVSTILKFERDNELIICWASGLNKIKIVNLILYISLVIMVLQIILTTILNPSLLNLSRSIIKNSQMDFLPSLLKERKFNDTIEGLTIFVDKKINNKSYQNIFIRDEGGVLSKVSELSSTTFAKSGRISEDKTKLILYNGNIQRLKLDGKVNFISFKKTVFNLGGLNTKSISLPKIQETPTNIILQCLNGKNSVSGKLADRYDFDLPRFKHNCDEKEKTLINLKIEINKRFGMPFTIPLLSLICSFLLASGKGKKTYSFLNKYVYLSLGFLTIIVSEITVRYSGFSWVHTSLFYLVPIFLLPVFYLLLIKKFKYENV